MFSQSCYMWKVHFFDTHACSATCKKLFLLKSFKPVLSHKVMFLVTYSDLCPTLLKN